ncbi:MAG: hypothetical protein R3272_16215 [Candidatus Promineifilaceae bacterium]|nr:hypothetical protein [Candidatus Promineifilaceae bacterium]
MGLGALLTVALAAGGYAALAQSDGAETEAQQDPQGSGPEDALEAPAPGVRRFHPAAGVDEQQLLADALGITVEELEAAHEAARAAAVEQALAEGLITEAQAEALLAGDVAPRAGRFFRGYLLQGLELEPQQLLADALGSSVEELEAAKAEVREARLAAMVDAGALSEEEAEMIAARHAVAAYVDHEAIGEMVQNSIEAAIAEALADGAITQEQADQMLEKLERLDGFRFHFGPDGFGRGHGPRHHHGGDGGRRGFGGRSGAAPAMQPGISG